MRIKIGIILFLGLSLPLVNYAQTNRKPSRHQIFLNNPSFEDTPHAGDKSGSTIEGWYDCGKEYFPGETAPDIHPSPDSSIPFFGVRNTPADGKTFLGLVVRENNSWESVSQKLSQPLLADQCYSFSIYLCRSNTYVSGIEKRPDLLVPFTQPIIMRIWGGTSYCGKQELLASSTSIKNTNWVKYQFKFAPKQNVSYIMLEAFYEMPILFEYNGNILVDKASSIVEIDCDDALAVVEKKEQIVPKPKAVKKPDPIASNPTPKSTETAFSAKMNAKELKEGQTIRIDKLFFAADSTNFSDESLPILQDLADFMKENSNIRVEIGGHTNDIPEASYCDKLSTMRAKSIYDYLLKSGIDTNRLEYKGYGKRNPLTSNKTAEGRRRNQRVEIKILSIKG